MRKIISCLLSLILSASGFSQTPTINDSTKSPTGLPSKPIVNNLTKSNPELILYPNPAKNKITLQVKNFDPGMALVKVIDLKGKTVKEDSRLLTNGTEDIIMFLMLKAGIYFIMITEPGKVVRKKLVML